ncbi:hypothetical protein [Idiomarina sp. HP20-50]|uniref:hypothetical protein n=1 Tax=Idiomarina sp. HP20-50 TaxID=3070813 RepID=UPI00294AFFF6|nr:hypothetical protein [Idiomarina sp. HP20-50]MDV6315443.1 hypothetical protein [Idiomarina sp. HP20-50]
MFFKQRGQAAIEFILSGGVLVVIYLSLYQTLIPAVEGNTDNLIAARKAIWERIRDDEKTLLSGNYRLNEHTKIFFNPLNRILPVNLEGKNLRVLRPLDESYVYPMVRLNDSWQARTSSELSSRPASLVVNNVLSGDVTRLVQDGIGRLFLAEELRSDSLVFGTISPDVVPPEAYQERN